MSIRENYENIKSTLPENVRLVVVSKNNEAEKVREVYHLGQRDFGENRVQELLSKKEDLPEDIRWHLIGHLQRNKVKQIIHFIYLIQSVDSERLLNKIQQEAKEIERTIPVLLQVKIAQEDSKYGFSNEELSEVLQKYKGDNYPNVKVKGLMGMGTLTNDKEKTNQEFHTLKSIYDQYATKFNFDTLSMGMSSDYKLAIENGSNLIRIGSRIFR